MHQLSISRYVWYEVPETKRRDIRDILTSLSQLQPDSRSEKDKEKNRAEDKKVDVKVDDIGNVADKGGEIGADKDEIHTVPRELTA